MVLFHDFMFERIGIVPCSLAANSMLMRFVRTPCLTGYCTVPKSEDSGLTEGAIYENA